MRILKNANLMLVGIFALFVTGILATPSYARIDPNTVVGIWLFDENEGDSVADSSENGHDGTTRGAPQWTDGWSGSAMTFNGSTDYVDCGNAADMNLDAFSVTFWANIPTTQGWNHMVSRGSHKGGGNPGAVNWGVMMVSNEPIVLFEVFNNTGWKGLRANTTTDKWHHLVATYDGDTMQLYHDGNLAATTSGAGVLLDEGRPLMIGAKSHDGGPASFFNGTIDEVGYFSVIIAPEDIQNIMTNGLADAVGLAAVSPSGKLAATWGQLKRAGEKVRK